MGRKFIQIKNAKKVFKHTLFKLRGHDFLKLIAEVSKKVSVKEGTALINAHHNYEARSGDYEIYIRVFPGKIEIVDMLNDDFRGVF